MALAPTTSGWAVLTGQRARAGYAAAVITAFAFWCLGRWDLVARLSPLELLVLFGGGNLATKLVAFWCRAAASYVRLLVRIAAETALITIVMYATGWGPVLAIGYMFLVHDVVGEVGARAWRIALVCALTGIVVGQLAIAADIAPSFIAAPRVHGLATLGALGLALKIVTFSPYRNQRGKEHHEPWCAAKRPHKPCFRRNMRCVIACKLLGDTDRSFISSARDRARSWGIGRCLGEPRRMIHRGPRRHA